jgi:hypothetical protein
MKSFKEYPLHFPKKLLGSIGDNICSGILMAHHELYRKVSQVEGSIVKCGVAAEEDFTQFAMLKNRISNATNQPVIAFEKIPKRLYVTGSCEESSNLQYQSKKSSVGMEQLQENLVQAGIADQVSFIPGNITDSIPLYLIENPEMKIAYLDIDFDDYECTLTTLQYFYPRLVHGGILIFDNYYKKEEDYKAVKDYFRYLTGRIYNYSVNKGPDYLIRL